MTDITLPDSIIAARAASRERVVPRTAQRGLIVLLALVYGGGFLFLATISPLLLYAFYVAMLALIALRFESLDQLAGDLRPLLPYMAWVTAFWCWGVLMSPYPGAVFGEVIRLLFRNLLFLVGVAVALSDPRSEKLFSRLVQVGIFVNYYLAQRQLNDPQFAIDFARRLGEETYIANNVRPAGLWINPDEAAFALLFGLLIIARDKGIVVWLARAAAVHGIYLSASRSGNYILVLFIVSYLLYSLSRKLFSFRQAMIMVNVAAVAFAIWLGLYYTENLPTYDVSQDFALSRILDHQESNTDYTRGDLTSAVLGLVMQAPWYGYGALGLQDAQTSELYFQSALPGLGAHNIYLAVWGEAGVLGLLSYLAVLGLGILAALRLPMSPQRRLIACLMWAGYLIRGLTWHSQLINGVGILVVGLVLCYPRLAAREQAESERAEAYHPHPGPLQRGEGA